MDEKCEHVYMLGHRLMVDGTKASMLPICYWCVRCDKTLFELTGIMGPPIWIKEKDDLDPNLVYKEYCCEEFEALVATKLFTNSGGMGTTWWCRFSEDLYHTSRYHWLNYCPFCGEKLPAVTQKTARRNDEAN